jgi:glycolate oxidase iron-sulfur subunit
VRKGPPPEEKLQLLAEADRCVKCGLCLPTCPTYRLSGLEAESPRGRIALIQGLLQGDLTHTVALETHLDNCLACRACEAACPSGVRYGALIDGARAFLDRPRAAGRRAVLWALSRPALGAAALRVARTLRLHRLAGAMPAGARRLLRLATPGRTPRWVAPHSRAGGARGRVGLFSGCVAREADLAVLGAARALLEALGYEVVAPRGQGCCGAMHRHAGVLEGAAALASAHARTWAAAGVEVVLSTATGCGAALREHGRWSNVAAPPAPPAVDLLTFLAAADWSALAPRPLATRIAVHLPCSARDAGLGSATVLSLLGRIPGVETDLLDPSLGCCGAAGAYLLHHAANADTLRTPSLDAIAASGAAIVVTANVGCAMHLRAGLAERGHATRVAHPAEILAEAYLPQAR